MSSPLLELYYFESCPFCQMVLSVIDELHIKVTYKDILRDPESKKKLVEDTGKKTVPCLYIDHKPMHESREIINWLKTNAGRLESLE